MQNPCDDRRHLAIWSESKLKLCKVVPKLLIVGPQKTGTTALQSFLKLNPSIRTSLPSDEDFEEVQFFNDKHYLKGVDWYLKRFLAEDHHRGRGRSRRYNYHQQQQDDDKINRTTTADDTYVYLDKSATYFDDPKVPRRASSLLPNAYILIVLLDPVDRAYSWYQHIKAHKDPIANEFSFDELIMFQDPREIVAPSSLPKANSTMSMATSVSSSSGGRTLSERQIVALKALRNRCLHPGYYSNHLLRWLTYYQPRQIVIIGGEWFKYNPMAVLNRLQLLLRLPEQVDYEKLLVYNHAKGFYCERSNVVNGHASRQATNGGGRDDDDDDDASSSRLFQNSTRALNQSETMIKCLGPGKGRKYAPMSAKARDYLNDHYLSHNRQLARLLYEIGQPLPSWLDRSMNPLPTTVRHH
jgi:heparan sulfate N-deacetylase/N-sulfotransferase NDST2